MQIQQHLIPFSPERAQFHCAQLLHRPSSLRNLSNRCGAAQAENPRCSVIEGFRIDITADELSRRLDSRIQYHRDEAAECDRKRIRADAITSPDPADPEEQLAACWNGYREHMERRAAHHRYQEYVLGFLRDHLVTYEIYRLDLSDLQELELACVDDDEPSEPGDRL
jgi:hypothetical protein